MENKTYKIENLNVKFLPLTAREGIKVTESLLGCIKNNENVDIAKFSKDSLELIISKLQVETQDASGSSYKNVGDIDSLALFFKSPLVSLEIVTYFMDYLSPFLNSIKGLNTLKQIQR
ncbi:hypothetical protein CQA66_08420 [Helicobacter aurati]|uniref:Uncharacterized protein n=1 Tax=Helicobacter aurati TaxID=137778 RepID=A0A3D8IZC5_9HELI|nr:hypothetical protein [Helicobacter aurati]RDU70423.1 hypothetical protein CQA66_08420 [Helicobacter aurati]